MIQLFQSMPVPNRGFKNPNASKPHVMGQGMEWFDKNNSPEQVAARQNRVNQEQGQRSAMAQQAGSAAVEHAKQTKGYTNSDGIFVPPTMPMVPTSKYGTGSVKYLQPGEARPMATTTDPLTGKKVPLRSFLDDTMAVQATKYGPNAEQAGKDFFNPKSAAFNPPKAQVSFTQPITPKPQVQDAMAKANADFDALFANAPMAQPEQTRIAQMPSFESVGMAPPGPPSFMGPPLPPFAPNDGPSLPFGAPNQLAALRALDARGFPARAANKPPQAPSRFKMGLQNYFPGNDYDYLQQLFPGIPLDQILQMVENPAYASQFNR
jgi:hypothetical protein